jgi:hypothetical protein
VLPGFAFEKATAYSIYQVDAAPAPPGLPDPDANTADMAEQTGKTESRLFGGATGYGARALFANGVATIPPAPSAGTQSPTAQTLSDRLGSKCGFTDRELVAGRVSKAQYDTGSTAAEAIAVGVDERTKVDLSQPSRCDITVRDGRQEYFSGIFATAPPLSEYDSGPGWTRKAAECTSSEGEPGKRALGDDGGGYSLGSSEVVCPTPGGTLEANAHAELVGPLAVGHASTKSKISRGSDVRGVTAEVEAVARDIDIAGLIHIREVKSVARSFSNGRPQKDAMSSHEVSIEGVVIDGQSVCGKQCDTNAVLAALNRAVSGRAQFRVASGLDDRLRRGTPKGALTAVQKSPERQASDQALVGDFTTEVPGLELIVYNDNVDWGRARQLYQFAGVATAATYNIARVPDFSAFPEDAGNGSAASGDVGILEPSMETGGANGLPSIGGAGSGTGGGGPSAITRALRALARGIRLFATNPRQALLLLTAWSLFGLPAALSRRRRLLAAARSV